jgi:GNAT superfamily N-acetyltransferase
MAAYLDGVHHPQHALPPRIAYVALEGSTVVGYIAGHLTRRFDCDGEIQYLYVTPSRRRRGVATVLLRRLAAWFAEHNAPRICVDVDPTSPAARAFYARSGATRLNAAGWMNWADVRTGIGIGGEMGRRPDTPSETAQRGDPADLAAPAR